MALRSSCLAQCLSGRASGGRNAGIIQTAISRNVSSSALPNSHLMACTGRHGVSQS